MKKNKFKFKLIFNVIFFSSIILAIIYNKEISTYIVNNFIYNKNATIKITDNEYSLKKNYEFVSITDNFVAKDYEHLLDIIYTIIDSGNEEFYFFCSDEYKSCLKDIDALIPNAEATEDDILSEINNLVHPYNTYKKLTVVMNNYGKITVKITKQYSKHDITYINSEIDKFEETNKDKLNSLSNNDKIKLFHDHIINNTKYDKERANNLEDKIYANSDSHTAIGLLKNNLALCGGYSDIMSIYISRLNMPNIRISADKHVWNLIYTDDKWLHIDATWDDPITSTGSQILIHDYFLINTETLLKYDTIEHNFNKDFYIEAK